MKKIIAFLLLISGINLVATDILSDDSSESIRGGKKDICPLEQGQ